MNARSSLLTVSQDEINWARQNSIFVAQHDYNDGLHNAEWRGTHSPVHASTFSRHTTYTTKTNSPAQHEAARGCTRISQDMRG